MQRDTSRAAVFAQIPAVHLRGCTTKKTTFADKVMDDSYTRGACGMDLTAWLAKQPTVLGVVFRAIYIFEQGARIGYRKKISTKINFTRQLAFCSGITCKVFPASFYALRAPLFLERTVYILVFL